MKGDELVADEHMDPVGGGDVETVVDHGGIAEPEGVADDMMRVVHVEGGVALEIGVVADAVDVPNIELAHLLHRLRKALIHHASFLVAHKTPELSQCSHIDGSAIGIDRPYLRIAWKGVGVPHRTVELQQPFVVGKIHPSLTALCDLPVLVSRVVLLSGVVHHGTLPVVFCHQRESGEKKTGKKYPVF